MFSRLIEGRMLCAALIHGVGTAVGELATGKIGGWARWGRCGVIAVPHTLGGSLGELNSSIAAYTDAGAH